MVKKNVGLLQMLSDYFTDYLPSVKGLSNNTISSYQYAFQLLFEFMSNEKKLSPEKVTFESLTGGVITDYLNWLETSRKCSAKTRNLRRAAISSFSKYAIRRSIGEGAAFFNEVRDTPKKKIPKDVDIKYFTKEEVAILLSLPTTSKATGYRDAVLLSLLYASGARAQEICDLTVNDIIFGKTTTIRLVGKGNKARRITVPENCVRILKEYMNRNGMADGTDTSRLRHIFSSQTHEHMTISCVEGITKKYLSQAKNEHPNLFRQHDYSPHSFRHSIAVHMLESGVPIPVIKVFLGHASISTTMVYAAVTPELANKYLSSRNKLLESVNSPQTPVAAFATLPFLKKGNQANIK